MYLNSGSNNGPSDTLAESNQQLLIQQLKQEAAQLCGGPTIAWEAPDLDPEVRRQFWEYVVRYHQTMSKPRPSLFDQLLRSGVRLRACSP